MTDIETIDYSALDRPEVTLYLFHPRGSLDLPGSAPGAEDVMIPVEDGVSIGGRFHMAGKDAPNILFFHGNGEIVSDYDDLAPIYNRMGAGFMPVDYRGYGRSGGSPTVSAMMRDCHRIFDFTKTWLDDNGYTGPLAVMGRSLGSASALELAAHHPDRMDGLIIESGFAHAVPLLRLLGINTAALGIDGDDRFNNTEKIRKFPKPVLVIHAEHDHIIPFTDGQDLHDACGSPDKTLLKIPGANHNDILHRGFQEYMAAVRGLLERL